MRNSAAIAVLTLALSACNPAGEAGIDDARCAYCAEPVTYDYHQNPVTYYLGNRDRYQGARLIAVVGTIVPQTYFGDSMRSLVEYHICEGEPEPTEAAFAERCILLDFYDYVAPARAAERVGEPVLIYGELLFHSGCSAPNSCIGGRRPDAVSEEAYDRWFNTPKYSLTVSHIWRYSGNIFTRKPSGIKVPEEYYELKRWRREQRPGQ